MTQLNFNARTVAPAIPGETIPPDWYKAFMSESKLVPNSAQNGHYLQCQFTIMEGPFSGRKMTDRLNLDNPSAVAVTIAYEALSAICHATGVLDCQDSEQLHNRPLDIKVGVRPAGPGADGKNYDAANEIKGYRPCQASAPTFAAPQAPAAPTFPGNAAMPGFAPPPMQAPAPTFAPPPAAASPTFAPSFAPPAVAPVPQPTIAPSQAPQPAPPFAGSTPWAPGAPVAPAAPAAPAVGGAVPPWAQPR